MKSMEWVGNIDAVLFDMDGTLLDSEPLTEHAIFTLLRHHGIESEVDGAQFHGVTWKSIATTLKVLFPTLKNVEVALDLAVAFHQALITEEPSPILGSPDAVKASSRRLKTAVVSSSRIASIKLVVNRLELNDHVHQIVGAEDVQNSKPHPQCFQLAAKRLGVSCERCLVFEDSMAGLAAAKAAGMRTIAIGPSSEKEALSDLMISNYHDLPEGFFKALGAT